MVDTRDLKSLDPKGCAGSSPVSGTFLIVMVNGLTFGLGLFSLFSLLTYFR